VSLLLDADLEEFRRAIRAAATARIGPRVRELDRTQAFSRAVWDELRTLEVFTLPFAADVGGAGGSFLAFVVATEEIATVGATPALYPGTTVQVAATLLQHGRPEQIERWLPRLLTADAPAAWAFTEPQTGSDPRQVETTARPSGDGGWIINGRKTFISFARVAGLALVFARVPDGGLGAFVIDPATPGWSTDPPFELMAFGGVEAAPVQLDDVLVAGDALLGEPGQGFDVMLTGEAQGKIRVAAICVGIAQRALDEAASYAEGRTHRGESIGRKFPTIQGLLGEMQASVLAARALVRSAASMVDAGAPVADVAASARIVAGRTAREVTSNALQVCGAYGLTRELVVERLYREGKFFEVAQGVTEIQRAIVGRHVMDRVD
jgi:alkylation response protein AidB-like acyl-CoA dehydrogenase